MWQNKVKLPTWHPHTSKLGVFLLWYLSYNRVTPKILKSKIKSWTITLEKSFVRHSIGDMLLQHGQFFLQHSNRSLGLWLSTRWSSWLAFRFMSYEKMQTSVSLKIRITLNSVICSSLRAPRTETNEGYHRSKCSLSGSLQAIIERNDRQYCQNHLNCNFSLFLFLGLLVCLAKIMEFHCWAFLKSYLDTWLYFFPWTLKIGLMS